MLLFLIAICIATVCLLIAFWTKRITGRHNMERHAITPEDLYTLLASDHEVLLYDVRQPLDFLANTEIIPGAMRIPPRDVLEDPLLIPKDKDSVVYCTCPTDETSLRILRRAQGMQFFRMKFLKGGLESWKEKGFPVERYDKPFQLDTRR